MSFPERRAAWLLSRPARRLVCGWPRVLLDLAVMAVLALGFGAGCAADDATGGAAADGSAELDAAALPDMQPFDAPAPFADGSAGPGDAVAGDGNADAKPFGLGEPCVDNADCPSGWCVSVDGGGVCTVLCLEDCPAGWHCRGVLNTSPDIVFLCIPDRSRLCQPCTADEHCDVGLCLPLADGQRCSEPCRADTDCRVGFVCEPHASATQPGPPTLQCVPRSGRCDCTAYSAGSERPCAVSNAHGTCWGTERCTGDAGWTACSGGAPAAETCNGRDDDCSGLVDDVPGRGAPCTIANEHGVCASLLACDNETGALVCPAATPAPERCNYRDDDCDGTTDENFPDLYTNCTAGTGDCTRYGFVGCASDELGTACNATPGVAVPERCDGFDNDCDGSVDEDWPLINTLCWAGTGACRQAGLLACDPAEPTGDAVCTAVPAAPTSETCDGLDNDCDGLSDEDWRPSGDDYASDVACGNCFTDCQVIYAKPQAFGQCCHALSTPPCARPQCVMRCLPAHFDLNGIPADGCEFALDAGAIYVSETDPAANNLPGCGRGPAATGAGRWPCRAVGVGLHEAETSGRRRVLVADGLYEENVALVAGIDLLGGYRADTWERHAASTLAILRGGETAAGARTVAAENVVVPTVFEGFMVYGPAAYATGENSVGIWLRDCGSGLSVRDNTVYGGVGGPGAAGSDGFEGANGPAGIAGDPSLGTRASALDECRALPTTPANQGPGGDAGRQVCSADDVSGGAGAGADCPHYNAAQDAGLAGLSADAGPGAGGSGGSGGHDRFSGVDCGAFYTDGEVATGGAGGDGGPGRDGAAGFGCTAAQAAGVISGGEWRGLSGLGGGVGTHGGGGGGGGAGGGADLPMDCGGDLDTLGGSGGGGGGGGCAGSGGRGGSPGGGAFAVFIANSSVQAGLPQLRGNRIVRGSGGPGGVGGNGGVGGVGGDGGAGGDVSGSWAFVLGPGGRGGQGGRGGHGGGGGGGCGGVAFGLYVHGYSLRPTYESLNVFAGGGTGGPGGGGGPSLGRPGVPGAAGVAADWNY